MSLVLHSGLRVAVMTAMAKLLFLPFSISTGLLAGLVSKKTFERLWGLVDDRQAPQPKDREVQLSKLALALAIEGALFRVVKGVVDHGSRAGFARLTGAWPGDEDPSPSQSREHE